MTPEQKEIALRVALEVTDLDPDCFTWSREALFEFATRFLAALPKSEPVAWMYKNKNTDDWYLRWTEVKEKGFVQHALYTAPPDQSARIAELKTLCARLKQEAQIHAQEARTANATIAEIYQCVTGSTGEPGNWHGAEPVRQRIAELEQTVETMRDSQIDKLLAMTDEQVNALCRLEGRSPEDSARLAKQAMNLATANVRIAELERQVEQMAAQVEVAREAFKTICDDPCNEWEVANKALATLSDPSAILAERDARVWEKAADFLDGYHYLSANFAAAQEDMRKEAARIREGVKS